MKSNPAKPSSVRSSAVYFQRPDCAEPSVVVPFSLNFEALPFLARIVPSRSYTQTFLYLDGEWPTQSRVRMFLEWLKHAVLEVAGNTRYLPVKTAIVLAEPSSCRSPAYIDWRLIWDNEERNQGQPFKDGGLIFRKEAGQGWRPMLPPEYAWALLFWGAVTAACLVEAMWPG